MVNTDIVKQLSFPHFSKEARTPRKKKRRTPQNAYPKITFPEGNIYSVVDILFLTVTIIGYVLL